jgi:DNA-binding MarR family transcriptional regulator
MALLAYQEAASAQQVSKVIGMDKASISRCFKNMLDASLIEMDSDPADGRLKIARLTAKGHELHDIIIGVALERERAFMSVLSPAERDVFVNLLQRLHENLPQVEVATSTYLAEHFHCATDKRAGKKRRNTGSVG